ncbi:MAG: hypothetical protein IT478_00480 [Xanthomonadales bacterium]|nr:hypothetical protein [Xanthomonadales bacterium]
MTRIDGRTFAYADIWQQRNLLLVCLAGGDADGGRQTAAYAASLTAHDDEFQEYETTVVITSERVTGLPSPAAIVADRWGEIVAIEPAPDVASLPDVSDLLAWLRFVAHACPECEGEAR